MLKLVTHDGPFHVDDLFAYATLKLLYGNVCLTRTRKFEHGPGTIVFDVGGQYDPEKDVYDHHFMDGPRRENGIPYSSAGLIWAHFGRMLLQHLFRGDLDDASIEAVWKTVDGGLFEPIDAFDNGLSSEAKILTFLMKGFNPSWDECQDFDSAFLKAAEVAALMLDRTISHHASARRAVSIAQRAIAATAADDKVLVLEQYVPWQDAVAAAPREFLYVVFPGVPAGWRVQCVPDLDGSSERKQRKPLPAAWAGKSGKDLAEVSGVNDATFCHPGRFIAGAETKEGAVKLARLAVAE